nr:ORF3 [Torque teno midi virus]
MPPKEGRKNQEMSPGTLRRKYLPRITRPPAPHPTTAPATAAAQVKHPGAPQRPQTAAEIPKSANRKPTLTRFKPGFEWETEKQVAQAFNRPPRLFKEDKPFYPWLPKPEPIVNFHLNFKF